MSGENGAAAPDDRVLPFHLDGLDIRGRVARLDDTLHQILSQHDYPPSVGALVAEATLLAAMIGQAMDLRGRFSLQARAQAQDAAVALVAADYVAPTQSSSPGQLRAYAKFDPERTPETSDNPAALLGEGYFAMIIDQGPHTEPYQGVTPLLPGGLTASAEAYFAQSEQVATRFKLALGQSEAPGGVRRWRGGGVMLQHLARYGEHIDFEAARGVEAREAEDKGERRLMSAEDVVAMDGQGDAWRTASLKLDTAEELELTGPYVTAERLLVRLFHEDQPRVFPPQRVAFGCNCGPDKVVTLLVSYKEEDIADMAEDGVIHADCQFCGSRYSFTLEELAAMRDA